MSTLDYRILPGRQFAVQYAEAAWASSPEIRAEFKGSKALFQAYCSAAWQGANGAATDSRIGPVTRARFVRDACAALVATHAAGANLQAAHCAMVLRSAGVDLATLAR